MHKKKMYSSTRPSRTWIPLSALFLIHLLLLLPLPGLPSSSGPWLHHVWWLGHSFSREPLAYFLISSKPLLRWHHIWKASVNSYAPLYYYSSHLQLSLYICLIFLYSTEVLWTLYRFFCLPWLEHKFQEGSDFCSLLSPQNLDRIGHSVGGVEEGSGESI